MCIMDFLLIIESSVLIVVSKTLYNLGSNCCNMLSVLLDVFTVMVPWVWKLRVWRESTVSERSSFPDFHYLVETEDLKFVN